VLADAAAYALGGRYVCTHQMAAVFCIKRRHGRPLESVTSNRKSDFVNRCVIYFQNNPAKFHPDPTLNDVTLGFFYRASPNNKKNKNNNKTSSDMTMMMMMIRDQFLVQKEAVNYIKNDPLIVTGAFIYYKNRTRSTRKKYKKRNKNTKYTVSTVTQFKIV